MPKRPHNLPEERPQRAQVAVLLQQQLQEDDGQAVRRLLPVGGEDHVEGGHVARVPCVGELVEDDLLDEHGEVLWVREADLPGALHVEVRHWLRLEADLGEVGDDLDVHRRVRVAVDGQSQQQLVRDARHLCEEEN